MLRGVGGAGDESVHGMHGRCCGFFGGLGRGGVMVKFLELANMVDALELANMDDATEDVGWGGVG